MRQLFLIALALTTACASSGTPGSRPNGRAAADVLTRDEIQSAQWQSAYELIQTLRPRWLRAHGPDSILGESPEVQVHLDENRLGGVATLRNIATTNITSIRFVDPVTAAGQWGGDHANGAIIISTQR